MKKGLLLIAALAITFIGTAQVSDLVGMLSKEMGISNDQAAGGAGAIFGMAQENMGATDFSTLSDAVPDMDGLLGAVPSLGGGKTSMLGKAAQSLTGSPKVVAAFEKLGLSQSHVAIMTPLLVNYVEKEGGAAIAKIFSKSVTD